MYVFVTTSKVYFSTLEFRIFHLLLLLLPDYNVHSVIEPLHLGGSPVTVCITLRPFNGRFTGENGSTVSPLGSSSSTCSGKEPPGIGGRGFYGPGVLFATQPSVSKQ